MRTATGIFGLFCGLIVIGLVGRYGYKSTDVEADAWIMAFLFGAIAAGGLFGHAVAARLWRLSRAVAIAMGIVSAAALVLNLSNSLGAIAGRADMAASERADKNKAIRDAEAELARLTALRKELLAFTPTDAATVDAAKRAADSAANARAAECGDGDPKQRGRNCRDREESERKANEALATATAAKAATERAAKLEGDAEAERKKLSHLGATVTVNVQGAALARLFRLPDGEAEFAATAQQFGVAAIVELIIVMCLVAWEAMGSDPKRPRCDAEAHAAPKAEDNALTLAAVIADAQAEAPAQPLSHVELPAPRKTGGVRNFMLARLSPAKGREIDMKVLFLDYCGWCVAEELAPLEPREFFAELKGAFDKAAIETRADVDRVFVLDVRLAPLRLAANEGRKTENAGRRALGKMASRAS